MHFFLLIYLKKKIKNKIGIVGLGMCKKAAKKSNVKMEICLLVQHDYLKIYDWLDHVLWLWRCGCITNLAHISDVSGELQITLQEVINMIDSTTNKEMILTNVSQEEMMLTNVGQEKMMLTNVGQEEMMLTNIG